MQSYGSFYLVLVFNFILQFTVVFYLHSYYNILPGQGGRSQSDNGAAELAFCQRGKIKKTQGVHKKFTKKDEQFFKKRRIYK